jgi:hypothetical protein
MALRSPVLLSLPQQRAQDHVPATNPTLSQAWRTSNEIAAIADDLLVPESVRDQFSRQKKERAVATQRPRNYG